MKYLLGTVLVFIHPRTQIIKKSINCEACQVVMLSSCLDLDVLDALSYDGYASHNHSFKIMSSFVHLRKDNGNIYTLQIIWYSVIYLHFLHRALAYAVI